MHIVKEQNFGTVFPAVPEAKPAPFRHRWEHRGPIPAETLAERGRSAYTGVGIGESKRKSRLRGLVDPS